MQRGGGANAMTKRSSRADSDSVGVSLPSSATYHMTCSCGGGCDSWGFDFLHEAGLPKMPASPTRIIGLIAWSWGRIMPPPNTKKILKKKIIHASNYHSNFKYEIRVCSHLPKTNGTRPVFPLPPTTPPQTMPREERRCQRWGQ